MVLDKSPTVSSTPPSKRSRMFGKVPLYWVMVVPLVLQVAGAVAAVGWLSFLNGQRAVNEVATQLRTEASSRIRQHLDTYMAMPVEINELNASAAELGILNLKDFRTTGKYFWRQMQTYPVGYVAFGNAQGDFIGVERAATNKLLINEKSPQTNNRLLAYNTNQKGDRLGLERPPNPFDPLSEAWYVAGKKARKMVWSDVYPWEEQPNVLSIAANYPLYDGNNRLLGILSVDHLLTQISQFLHSIKVSKTGTTYVMERSGNLIAASAPDTRPYQMINGKAIRLKATDSPNFSIRTSAQHLLREVGSLSALQTSQQYDYIVDGQRQFLLVMPWQDRYGLDWLIVVVVPEADFMAQLHQNTWNTVWSCAIALLLASFLGIPISRWIARQILRLSQASQALANGNLNQTVQANGIAELETLARSFNQMAAQLRDSFAVLEQTNEVLEHRVQERTASLLAVESELRALFAAIPDLVVVYDRDGRFQKLVSNNPDLLFCPVEAQLGKAVTEVLPQAEAALILHSIQQTLATHEVVNIEYALPIHGQMTWFAASFSQLTEDTVLFVGRDMSDRKRIEDERRQAAESLLQNEQQLRRQNRVLLELAKSTVFHQGNLASASREITEAATRTLNVERASIWLLDSARTKLQCLDLYERSGDRHSSGLELSITDFPRYFQALEDEISIPADNAYTHTHTQEFVHSYLQTHNITSLLDAPIRSGGRTVGVVCLEQIGEPRNWTLEEQSFSRSIADLLALGLVAQERKQTEKALRLSQEKFAKAFSASPDFITITSLRTGAFIDVNDSFLQISGFSRAEVLGKTVFELGAWANRKDPAKLMQLLETEKSVRDMEIELRKKSGEVIIALISAEIIELEGEPCMLAVTKDITDRKLAEAVIQESQQKYRDVVESTNTIILRITPAGIITFVNTYAQHFFGYSEAELLGQNVVGTLVPWAENIETEMQAWMTAICQNPTLYQDTEAENLRRNGEPAWVKWSSKAIFNEHGELLEILSVGFDITDRKRAEAALQEKEQYLRLILNNIPQQVFWKDTNLVFLGCNENWAKAAQLDSPDDIIGKTDYDLLPNREIAEEFRAQDREIMRLDIPQLHVIAPKVQTYDGGTVWLDISKIPIHDAQDNVIGILGVVEDITQRRQAEEALRVEQEKSEKLLLNVLPEAIANRLKQSLDILHKRDSRALIAENFDEVTVLFADIVNFTDLSANISAADLVGLLNRIFLVFDDLCEKHGLEKIKTIGDAYMVVGGLPNPRPDHANAIANMALDMQTAISHFRTYEGYPIAVRVGINTGPVIAGVIGKKKFTYDLWGDVVNTASRMESHGTAGKIQVSEATYHHLRTQYEFEPRGTIEVKGKGRMKTYWLLERRATSEAVTAGPPQESV